MYLKSRRDKSFTFNSQIQIIGTFILQIRVGTGGWSYFGVDRDRLRTYAKAFNFTEVNSTFYALPSEKMAKFWRSRVPFDFEFAVRCHQSITHQLKFEPSKDVFQYYDKMKKICDVLRASILHFQTPISLKWTSVDIAAIKNFLGGIKKDGLTFALETRNPSGVRIPNDLLRVMEDNNFIHCVDISRGETPQVSHDIQYSRLFGKEEHNVYQFSDDELEAISHKGTRANMTYLVFHNVRMYKDAARLKIYHDTGHFAPITRLTGPDSLSAILEEDARFPSEKHELVASQGWKLFDLSSKQKRKVSEAFANLPDKRYESINDLLHELRQYNNFH